MSYIEHTTQVVDRAHATVRATDDELFVQFIDQGDGTTEVLVMDADAVIITRLIVDQLDLLHAIEAVAS